MRRAARKITGSIASYRHEDFEVKVMAEKAYLVANPSSACKAILFDAELCTCCLNCVDVCRTDVLIPKSGEGQAADRAVSR